MSQHFDAIIIGTGQADPSLAARFVTADLLRSGSIFCCVNDRLRNRPIPAVRQCRFSGDAPRMTALESRVEERVEGLSCC